MFYETVRADTIDDLNQKVNAKLKHGFRVFGGASASAHVILDTQTDEDIVRECFIQTLVKDDGAQPIVRNAVDHVHRA